MDEELDYFLKVTLKITPKNLRLFEQAFVHRSCLNESKRFTQSNERLEFLGDAILSLIVSQFLYLKRPQDDEGALTNLRSFIVKTPSLAKVSQKLSLGKLLKLSKGEESSGGRNNLQILANTYEALLGAIFLDQGISVATSFVQTTLLNILISYVRQGAPKDFKSQLQEIVQDKAKTSPRYKILQSLGPDHARKFIVGVFMRGKKWGEGTGSSKQAAEEEAAKEALAKFQHED